ncbi:isopentenyl-diphosphate Delta-isomerase 1-like [Tropilaelaps mercedesae]|uniref:isopentenyl-diphosphate Delta-isomerase n=1 Tax=Tropilaelaps mercedesae TaxID=418985 RepID=A0A1V9XPJ0_9ACAR|nr:isopentenyl-diphosphate Delta-isomerase 1-like [Tropilaelaps mercedesae]
MSTAATLTRCINTADEQKSELCLRNFDLQQVKLLEEECILVDENDNVIGTKSKRECHLMTNIQKEGTLHRAFSVFLFNSAGELLIQQRSDEKITFPGCFTNTCCSHPLATSSELTADPVAGVKRAAQRRMFIELGIPSEELPVEAFHYLTRIKYMAPSDNEWGEHEIDYILFVQRDIETLKTNPNEVKSVCYLSRDGIDHFITSLTKHGELLTPWFRLILNTFLKTWWDNLDNLELFKSHDVIHKLN